MMGSREDWMNCTRMMLKRRDWDVRETRATYREARDYCLIGLNETREGVSLIEHWRSFGAWVVF